jgi:hypothetical protein
MSRHHHGARVRDFTEAGRRVMALENELIRVELLPDKGSDITSFLHKPSDTDFMWRSARGLRPPIPGGRLPGPSDAVNFDEYEGGWMECFPNGGGGLTYRGAPLPFHGELWSAGWSVAITEDAPERISVTLTVETPRTPFRVEKRLTLESGRAALIVDESITNLSSIPMDFMWGHHPVFGPPFLDDTCRVDIPAATGSTSRPAPMNTSALEFPSEFDWPHAPLANGGTTDLSIVPGPDEGRLEWACLKELREGWYGITNGSRRVGFGMRWDVGVFPFVWYWQCWGGEPDYPWWGRHYNCALEPWTSWPDGLDNAMANGTSRVLDGNATVETRLIAVAYDGRERIDGIDADGEVY